MGRTKGFSKWAKPGRPCNYWVCEADTSKMQNLVSSRARYDRFDTSPNDISNISPENLGRTDGENKGIFKMGKARGGLAMTGFVRLTLPKCKNGFESSSL